MVVLLPLLLAGAMVAACKTVIVTETVTVTVTAQPVLQSATTHHPPPPAPSSTTFVTEIATHVPALSQAAPGPGPGPSQPAAPSATYNPLPLPAQSTDESPANFGSLTNKPDEAVIINSCSYPIYLSSVNSNPANPTNCDGDGVNGHEIPPGATYSERIRECAEGGVSLKIAKQSSGAKPMQIEYTKSSELYYNLSFLDCMVPGTTDLSACAGHEEGVQIASAKGCPVWACQPGEYCDTKGYTVPEYGNQNVATPIGGCGAGEGLVLELCAAKGA